jgi:hypothetical protein
MDIAWSSELLEYIYKIMRRHILNSPNINTNFRKNFNTSDFSKNEILKFNKWTGIFV